MKPLLTTTMLLAHSLLASLVAAAVSSVCSDIKVSYSDPDERAPVYLSATCKANRDSTRCSQLDLNQCLALALDADASSPATIVSQDGGNFGHSCTACNQDVSGDSLTMTCHCIAYYDADLGPIYMDSTFDLDNGTVIQDSNGFLKCFGHTGTFISSCAMQ